MIELERLTKRKGVVAAGQFSAAGKVLRAVGKLEPLDMERVAHICAAHDKEATETAKELHYGTHLDWCSLNGWVLWGGKYALCVAGHTGVFVDAAKADFNQLMADLFGPPAAACG